MNRTLDPLRSAALVLLLLASLAGCKKAVEQQAIAPKPTATPLPSGEVLGYTRAGALWISLYDGSQQRLLAAPPRGQALWFPSASPDGSHFLAWLSRPDGTQDVVRVELNGRMTQLTDIGVQAKPVMKNLRLGNAPAYSPDGKRIAYSFNGDLWVMDSSGYNAETLISDGASWSPAFSPDGKRLAYANGNKNKFDLWVADLESRDTYQVSDFAAFTVGRPQWTLDGRRLLLTRSQGDESDLVQLLADTDTPLADADVLTRDKASADGVFSPNGTHVVFSSAREDGATWNLYAMDAAGGNAKQLTKDGGLSPAWLKPSTATAMVFDSGPSRPTPAPAAPKAMPTAMVAATAPALVSKPASNAPQAAAPGPKPMAPAASAPVPGKPLAPATAPLASAPAPNANAGAPASKPAATARAIPAAAAPSPSSRQGTEATVPSNLSPAPTQPPAKAAPLRLRYKAVFDANQALAPAGLADLKKLAPRVKQYASEQVVIVGPLDSSSLKGKYPSNEARSLARAKTVAADLAKLAGIPAASIKAQPYSPPSASSSAPNSIQIYVELK